jgi:hypothetical protein
MQLVRPHRRPFALSIPANCITYFRVCPNGNDGEFGPYNYDPVLRSEAARKAAKTRRRSKGARMANESRGPEGRSLAAKAAAWTRAHGHDPAANPYLKANRNTDC